MNRNWDDHCDEDYDGVVVSDHSGGYEGNTFGDGWGTGDRGIGAHTGCGDDGTLDGDGGWSARVETLYNVVW